MFNLIFILTHEECKVYKKAISVAVIADKGLEIYYGNEAHITEY